MMHTTIIFTGILLALSTYVVSASEGECALDEKQTTTWSACIGQTVRLHGKRAMPQEIQQHPMRNHTAIDQPVLHQDYFNVQGQTQIILLSVQLLTCETEMWVEGELQQIDLGGTPNTKLSYRGWTLNVKNDACL